MKPIAIPILALSSLLFVAGCPEDLPAGDIKSPQYWGDFFLNKYAAERQAATDNVEPGPVPLTQPRTVLLITGVTIPAAWLDNIALRLQRDGFNTVVYEPPELLSGSLWKASEDLAEVVERVRAESGQDKIDILAECTGGVIARHYVQSLGGDAFVERLVVFVSPQNGIAKASLAAKIAPWPALDDLTPGSAFLEAVQNAPLPASVAMTSIYSCTDEYIQPYETSIVEGATNIGLCDGFVGHFQTMYDPQIYLIMHAALVEGLAGDEGDDDALEDDASGDDDGDDDGPELAGCSSTGSPSGLGALFLVGLFIVATATTRSRRRSSK